MVKHTQIIRPQQPTNCMSVFDHFVGLTLKRLTNLKYSVLQIHFLDFAYSNLGLLLQKKNSKLHGNEHKLPR